MESFSKILSDVDATKQMAVPSHFMEHLPTHAGGNTVYFPVMDLSDNMFQFGYYVRGTGRYGKPVFQGDWHRFVTEKDLHSGDKITFRMERDAGGVPRYTITAQKLAEFKLFGQNIWGPEF